MRSIPLRRAFKAILATAVILTACVVLRENLPTTAWIAAPDKSLSLFQHVQERSLVTERAVTSSREALTQTDITLIRCHPVLVRRPAGRISFGFFNRGGFLALWKRSDVRGWETLKKADLAKTFFIFTHPSAYKIFPALRDINPRDHLVSAILGMQSVTGSKIRQMKTLQEHAEKMGCSWSRLAIMPQSFSLSNSTQCSSFFALPSDYLDKSIWILKPASGYGGDGITLHHGRPAVDQLRKRFGDCRPWRSSSRVDNRFVVQHYIKRPLLLSGRKFDVRAFMLIASLQPYIVYYRRGYLRVSLSQFDVNATNTSDRARHLTNTHVQSLQANFSARGEDHFWSFARFQAYLDEKRPKDGKGFVENKLEPFVRNLSLFFFHAGRDRLDRRPGTFQLIGFDVMVDENLRLYFIEANNYPLWPYQNDFSRNLSLQMADDLFDVTLDLHTNDTSSYRHGRYGENHHNFELLFNELDECRAKRRIVYNPCTHIHP